MTNNPDDTKVNWQPVQTKKKKNKLIRILTIPIRLLTGVRDMYVKSMNNYADKAPYVGAAGGISGGGISQQPLPRSFSAVSSTRSSTGSDDLAELIRAVSTRDYGDKIDVDSVFHPTSINNNTPAISRSGSVRNDVVAGGGIGVRVGVGGDKVVRASSTGRLMKPAVVLNGGMKVPRSASVGMAKIDEDKVIEMFEDEDRSEGESDSKSKKKKKDKKKKKKNEVEVRKESALFPRNRSYKYPGTTIATPTTTASATTTTTTPVMAAATTAATAAAVF